MRRAPAWVAIMSEPQPTLLAEQLVELLRELGRTERLEGYERAALRRAASELERLQPDNLQTRSEYRAVTEDGETSAPYGSRQSAKSWVHGRYGALHHLEHRTVVESEWRRTHD